MKDFNSKQDLVDYIKNRVRQMLGKTEDVGYQTDPESPMNLMLANFPALEETLENLMTNKFRLYIDDIQWVAPKPTTFRILLANGQTFTLTWNSKGFLAKILGMKYDLLIYKDNERATKALSKLIQYGPISVNLGPEDLAQQRLTPATGEPLANTPPPNEVGPEEL
jgi:hypothetical protein